MGTRSEEEEEKAGWAGITGGIYTGFGGAILTAARRRARRGRQCCRNFVIFNKSMVVLYVSGLFRGIAIGGSPMIASTSLKTRKRLALMHYQMKAWPARQNFRYLQCSISCKF